MPHKSLQAHYERKYAFEGQLSSIQPIQRTTVPTTRFEAVITYFPNFFHHGDILELGSGSGAVARTLLESNLNISSYTASEISLPRLKLMNSRLHDSRLRILTLDAEEIPESEYGNYDAVVMIALIEHLIDPLKAMRDIRALLRPGGFVYVDTPNIAKFTRRIKLLIGRFPSTASMNEGLTTYSGEPVDLYDEGHLHYFTLHSLSQMLIHGCGFSRIVKLGYPSGRNVLGSRVHYMLSRIWPEMFSELAIVAYR